MSAMQKIAALCLWILAICLSGMTLAQPQGTPPLPSRTEGTPPMNIVLYGATGRTGRVILTELVQRGHHVTAIARNLERLPEPLPANVTPVRDDLGNIQRIAGIIAGADAVISAVGPASDDPRYSTDQDYTDQLLHVSERLIAAVRDAGIPRLIVVGGAGSLEYSPGVSVLDSGHWPEQYIPIAISHTKLLAALRASAINWTYFSPPISMISGERTGQFSLETGQLIRDTQGKSRISYEDYAQALVDELETPAHERMRFTIGYK